MRVGHFSRVQGFVLKCLIISSKWRRREQTTTYRFRRILTLCPTPTFPSIHQWLSPQCTHKRTTSNYGPSLSASHMMRSWLEYLSCGGTKEQCSLPNDYGDQCVCVVYLHACAQFSYVSLASNNPDKHQSVVFTAPEWCSPEGSRGRENSEKSPYHRGEVGRKMTSADIIIFHRESLLRPDSGDSPIVRVTHCFLGLSHVSH